MSAKTTPRAKPSHRTRTRYILVSIEAFPSPLERNLFIRALQAAVPAAWELWLTRYDGSFGILRVRRDAVDEARAFFDEKGLTAVAGGRVRALLTSGTIAGLERKHRGAAGLRQGRR